MLYSRLLLSLYAAALCRAAGPLDSNDLYVRQDAVDGDGDSVTVSTVTPESVSTSVIGGSTTEVPISGTTSTWILGTDSSDTTSLSITSIELLAMVGTETYYSVFGTSSITFTLDPSQETSVSLPAISTTASLPAIDTTVSISALQTVVSMADIVTTVSIPDDSTVVTFEDVTTTITITGTSSAVTVKGPSEDVSIDAVSSEVSIEGTSVVINIAATDSKFSNSGEGITSCTLSYSTSTTVQLAYTKKETFTLTRSGTAVTLKFEPTTVELSVPASTATVTGAGSTTEVTIPAVVTTITLSGTTSSTSIESSETTTVVGESSTESTNSSTTTAVQSPTANPTFCEVVRGTLTPEEEVQLQVLFSDRAGASAFADYVVSYASQLISQIDSVANIAVGDNNYAFTTAFDTIDVPGVLGLASAAPIYTCFLSSLWAQALANPQQYAKRAAPSGDEKIKLIVLFEKRATDGMQFDYAELLVDETNDLIAEVQSVSAAAAGGDLSAYASLFANVDVPYFLSIATEAPVYTEGLSAAIQTALSSYSESLLRPTVTAMTTRTYTNINTIITNVVNGTVTIPTTYYSTEIVVTVVPAGQVESTSTSTATATPPPGETSRVTTVGAPVNTVKTETVTLANGRVETRTVTICVENCETVVTQYTTRRPNVAVYTQVQNGVTYTHTIEIQTKNSAFKQAAALGTGILGVLALLL